MLSNIDTYTLISLVILAGLLICAAFMLFFNVTGGRIPLQQMFCPDDHSTCFCTSCRAERGET